MLYKINEIFYSIQAEGFHSGMPAIFIRFAGCNRDCKFCDTNHTTKEELNVTQILGTINQWDCKNIILTGGEPTIQKTRELIDYLKTIDSRYKLHVETNGYDFLEIISAHWITFSPKSPYTSYNNKYWNELKVLYEGQDLKPYEKYMCEHNYLQPVDIYGEMNTIETIEYIKKDPRWRLSIQWNKLIHIK